MKSKHPKLYKNNRFLLNFVTSYSIILLCILIMGFFFYYSAISNVESSLHKQNASLLETNVGDIDNSLRLFSTLSIQISSSSDIKQLLYFHEKNTKYYLLANSAMNYLTNIMSLEDLLPITNYYIYFPNTDYFLSSTTFSDSERFYYYNKQYIRSEYENWHELVTSYDNLCEFIPLHTYKEASDVYIYKQLVCSSISGYTQPGILYIEISENNLRNTFSTLNLEDNCSLFVTNQQNKQMLTLTDGNKLSYDPEKMVADYDSENHVDIIRSGSEKYLVTKITSSYNNWNYYLIQPASILLSDFYLMQKMYLAIILFTCCFTLIIIYFLSKQKIKPIIKMNDELVSSKEENKTLHSVLDLQRPYVYNAYLNRIMKGHISSNNDLSEITKFIGIETDNRSYAVLYAKIYLQDKSTDSNQINTFMASTDGPDNKNELNILAEYTDIITNAFTKYFGDEIYIYKSDFHIYALLISFPLTLNYDDFAKECQEKFSLLNEELYQDYNISIYAGLGKRNARLAYVWESYQQAKDAATYVREGNIFQCYSDLKRENSNYYYPLELANQLTNFIHHGNKRQLSEIFKILRRENFEYRTLSVTILNSLVADLKNTLLKTRFSVPETQYNASLLIKIDTEAKHAITFDDIEQLSLLCCSLYEKTIEKNPLITSIEDYINQNYADSSLCLKKISDEFSISESYFSTLFKSETQNNFSDYLERIRMERAMYLVKTSTINLSDIYLEVGYNNANSFRRAFKKIYGVSPKTVRDSK